ncbi:pentapeptide repeat-containing protein [Streptomyces bambusae]|nr:pentapeptide repeat-containing protein [Streptomyces bambusae]MCB5166234.1 pentapeptide repeat-containing protein [Streptomyces bambusae]
MPPRPHLRADCQNCFALCCAALPFTASADFPVTKPAGTPCKNLRTDHRCGIHDRLRDTGWRGCTVFDCFGAGQQISQITFGGRDWREDPDTRREMFDAFPVMRILHELLWYLTEALAQPAARRLHPDLRATLGQVEELTRADAATLTTADPHPLRARTGELLRQVSELVRAAHTPGRRKNHRGADLMGARLAGTDLRGADLRGAYLIAADLQGCDLRTADLLGSDLRDADLRGADLTGALFLTQAQVNAARGDTTTHIPPALDRPSHWQPPA